MINKIALVLTLIFSIQKVSAQINENYEMQYFQVNDSLALPLYGEHPQIDSAGHTLIFLFGYQLFESKLLNNGNWSLPMIAYKELAETNVRNPTIINDSTIFFENFHPCDASYEILSYKKSLSEWKLKEEKSLNTGKSSHSPTITADGRTMYITIYNKIWTKINVSYLKEDNTWSVPVPLPSPINIATSDSGFPYLINGGKKMIFASDYGKRNSHKGKWDLYMSELLEDGIWTSPINMAAINTEGNEKYCSVTKKGDIFIDKPTKFVDKPALKLFKSIDSKLHKYTEKYGKIAKYDGNCIYKINAHKLFKIKELVIVDKQIIDASTKQPFLLSQIAFELNAYQITEYACEALDRMVDLLNEFKDKSLIISAHTDDIGDAQYNLKLSQQRAEAVLNYLIAKGIAKTRLTAKGYGESKPKVPNTTEQNRAMNRRVEFIVK